MLNKHQILGNLCADPEIRKVGDSSVCRMRIATDRRWKNKDGTTEKESTYHTVTCWGQTAVNAHKYLKKGRMAYVEGRIKTTEWEKDGVKFRGHETVADLVIFLPDGSKPASKDGGEQPW